MQIFQSKSNANLTEDFLKTILLVDSFNVLFCVVRVSLTDRVSVRENDSVQLDPVGGRE